MRVLILGGTGLISTEITLQLVAQHHSVTVYNRGASGIDLPPSVQRLRGNRSDPEGFLKNMRSAGEFDCVIDMICYTPSEARALVTAFNGRVPQVIVCTTVDVYARPVAGYPIAEDAKLGGVSAYGQDKARCEAIFAEARRTAGFPVTIMRPAHCYGRGGTLRGHIIHSLGRDPIVLDRLRKGKPVVVHSDGSTNWVACHVKDVARAFVGAVNNRNSVGKRYNVTGDEHFTWDQYYQTLAMALGAPPPKLVHIPSDILAELWPERGSLCEVNLKFNNLFDNSAAKRDLGFRYTVPLLDGMRETIVWVQKTYGFEDPDVDARYDQLVTAWENGISLCRTQFWGTV
jgi:nucleoside-diphosphate-sugar epimerase